VTRRLLLSYLTVTVIILIMLEVPLALFFGQREQERFEADAERDAVVLASFYSDALQDDLAPDITLAEDFATKTGVRVVVVDTEGVSVLDTERETRRDYSTRPEIETALSGLRSGGVRRSDTLNSDLLYVAVPVASGGVVLGAVRLTVDAHEVSARTQRFYVGLTGVAIVVLLAIGGIGWAIARSVTRPLRDLRESATNFAEGDLAPADVPEDAPAEVRDLAETMNIMAARLDELIVTQKSFVSDASHQLRTPLTALRLRLENIEAGLDDDLEVAEMKAAIEETERLSELVEDLLRLARAEQTPRLAAIDLALLTRDRVDTWGAVAGTHQIELELVCPDGAVGVVANPGAIEQILDNLLSNALEASPADTKVTIEIAQRSHITTLTVSDQGPGLDDERKSNALERFWRGDRSTPGTGLGLSIAHALAAASRGDLSLVDNDDGGLSVIITLVSSNAAVSASSVSTLLRET
jgi:signal transduction histidine kinase